MKLKNEKKLRIDDLKKGIGDFDMIKVAVMGYGTVGSGVVEVIESNNELVSKRAGEEMHVKHILDLRDFPVTLTRQKWYMISILS